MWFIRYNKRMALTAKQEKFAQCIADGMNQADAYRTAYDASKSKPETIWTKASHVMADGKVAARVEELRGEVAELALWTRLHSVQALSGIVNGVEARPTEKVAAIKELNAMHGFNAPQKVEHTGAIGVASLDVSKLDTNVLLAIMAAKDAANQ